MGQKVNPHGLRVGVIKDWDSRWYAESDFADYLVEDYNIRTFLIFFPQSIATAENGKNGVMRSSPGPEPEKIKGARTPDEAG